ncbi:hypothetical protein LMH87_001882 [Akanthomyces muscarius]|uniref:Uncharacterized protein n=1 Tax=Akanthomyces muscarius TaxID=2231603 RepID=A0A9W8UJ45_AKAMU|nr:hypothetical protein LMH87_001882 [Akanthomyces muscarius]KAJ4147353.1 hypothetical protein LMH87_001882 [Akanthomyces muscarius]
MIMAAQGPKHPPPATHLNIRKPPCRDMASPFTIYLWDPWPHGARYSKLSRHRRHCQTVGRQSCVRWAALGPSCLHVVSAAARHGRRRGRTPLVPLHALVEESSIATNFVHLSEY